MRPATPSCRRRTACAGAPRLPDCATYMLWAVVSEERSTISCAALQRALPLLVPSQPGRAHHSHVRGRHHRGYVTCVRAWSSFRTPPTSSSCAAPRWPPSSPVITFGTFVRPGLLGSDEIGAALSQTVDDGQAKVDSLISEVWWALLLFPALCGVAISLAMLRTVLPRR